ncbi:hypothetical protein FOZ62_003913 [Perkinsus olseni]|uniref:Uncharacterized protein n=1 Tax=Perkinsus olseni TaxID=32597 RepID=A0A7J6SXW4_PEROL|nr:hypothetical protein FOZ62_003913 [Perkinsus olseni]
MFPSQKYSDRVWEAETLDELRRVGNFFVVQDKPQQHPKAGGAYTGHQGSLSMMLMFDEMGEVASASVKGGGTEEIQYVRYYPVGIKPGALSTVAYTTGGPARFLVLLEHQSAAITVTGVTYDMNTIGRWDDVGAAMTVMAHEQSMLTPVDCNGEARRLLGSSRASRSRHENGSHPPAGVDGYSAWAHGMTNTSLRLQDNDETMRDLVKMRGTVPPTTMKRSWTPSMKLNGHLEKPLKDRILSMDHPVTKELNDLCTEGTLYYLPDFQPIESDDGETKTGNYTASVGNGPPLPTLAVFCCEGSFLR